MSCRYNAAMIIVAITPMAADSDGVAMPKKIKPVTTKMSPNIGNTVRRV